MKGLLYQEIGIRKFEVAASVQFYNERKFQSPNHRYKKLIFNFQSNNPLITKIIKTQKLKKESRFEIFLKLYKYS